MDPNDEESDYDYEFTAESNWTKWLDGFAFDYKDYNIQKQLSEYENTKETQNLLEKETKKLVKQR